MPSTTLNIRQLPADMQSAIAAFHKRGNPVQSIASGNTTLPPAVATYAECGATRDDIRAALAGLITYATPPRHNRRNRAK